MTTSPALVTNVSLHKYYLLFNLSLAAVEAFFIRSNEENLLSTATTVSPGQEAKTSTKVRNSIF